MWIHLLQFVQNAIPYAFINYNVGNHNVVLVGGQIQTKIERNIWNKMGPPRLDSGLLFDPSIYPSIGRSQRNNKEKGRFPTEVSHLRIVYFLVYLPL